MKLLCYGVVGCLALSLASGVVAKDDCKKQADPKFPDNDETVRFETKIKNNLSETLTANFYKTKPDEQERKKYSSKAMAPGQSIEVVDNVQKGGWSTFSVDLSSYDGTATFTNTNFKVFNASGGGRTELSKGVFDSKITCDRRWSKGTKRWKIQYTIDPE